jgi:hypothetical protein
MPRSNRLFRPCLLPLRDQPRDVAGLAAAAVVLVLLHRGSCEGRGSAAGSVGAALIPGNDPQSALNHVHCRTPGAVTGERDPSLRAPRAHAAARAGAYPPATSSEKASR